MTRRTSLSRRLVVSNLAVVAIAALALFATARLLGPELFDTEVRQIGQRYGWTDETSPRGGGPAGRGGGAGQDGAIESELNDAFSGSLTLALAVALAVGGAAAVIGALVVSRRVVRPIDGMRGAVRRIADGRYDERVPCPPDRELLQLAEDVNRLGAVLESTEERRARLVSDLAHELRTPITSLDGFVEGLEDGVFEPTPETLGAMRGETRRLQRLADDLGALSRADEQAFDLHVAPGDLGETAVDAARGLAAAFASGQVALEIGGLPPLPVTMDADRMGQVFVNLLRNALRHTPPGGVVTITGEDDGDRAVVAVTDTGRGIAAEHLERVFDRFFRVDAVAPAAGGTGIGLTIARGIVRAHGGDISASSPGPGAGTVFTVALPHRG
jgi:histidine kinase